MKMVRGSGAYPKATAMLSVSNSTESLQALQRVPGSGGGASGGNDIVIVTDKLAARQGKEEGAGPRRMDGGLAEQSPNHFLSLPLAC